MKQLAPNTMIQNRYLVVHPIGKGGMGEVYLAVDQRLGSAVALKRTRFESDSELGTAFEREAKILGRLRHPVLPKVIDHFVENDGQFLVMEHISGDDIAKRLETARKPFPLSWAMFWADQLLDALNYLHSHEPPIIHRDIKPQNLKLTDDNHIVLLDFGLSKDFESVNTGGSGGVGSIVGYSPGFAPMEQVRGTGTDARSDIYSLSATLYQLLSNAVPPDALTRADAMLGGAGDPVRPLDEINPEVPAGVSQVILKGMAIRQDERFLTAGEMQKSLRRAVNQSKAAERVPEAVPATFVQASAVDTQQPEPVIDNKVKPESVPEAVVSGTLDATVRMETSELSTVIKQSDVATAIINPSQLVDAAVTARPDHDTHSKTETTQEREPKQEPARAMAAGAGAAAAAPPPASPLVQPRPTGKSGSSKGLLIGGLVGLLVLGGIAAGGGWYAYNRMSATSAASPSPTPAPTPEPTVQLTGDTAETNTNSAVSEVTPIESPGDANSANTAASKQQVTQPGRDTPGKTAPASSKPSAKPKRKDDRTTILQ